MATIVDDDRDSIPKQPEKIHSLKHKTTKNRFEFGMTQKMFFFVTVPMSIAAAIYIAHGILKIIENAK